MKCLRAGWGGFEHRDRISTYGEYYGSEEEACGGTFPTFLELGANDKKDLAFKTINVVAVLRLGCIVKIRILGLIALEIILYFNLIHLNFSFIWSCY